MKKIITLLFACAGLLQAEDVLEFRAATSQYGFGDWMRIYKNKISTDLYYVRVPGNNEFNACGGYALPKFSGISITPFACATVAKEDREFGLKFPVSVVFQTGTFKADIYYGHFVPLRGDVSAYDILDSGNFTRSFGQIIGDGVWRWETGISTNFFHQDGAWNPLIGPLLRRNDKYGFWAVSLLSVTSTELRFSRVITFNKQEN